MDKNEPAKQPSGEPDSLQNFLADTEAELHRRLREACDAEARGVSTESTTEIRQLEDTLLAAAAAAETTIAVRKRVRGQNRKSVGTTPSSGEKPKSAPPPPEKSAAERGGGASTSVREFADEAGQRWRAWPVVPELSRAREGGKGFLGNFQEGWICFEGLDAPKRRRLPYRPSDWADLNEQRLRSLLGEAIDAPVRKPSEGKSK